VIALHAQGSALLATAHTLKWATYVMPRGPLRIIIAALMWFPLTLWRWLDAPAARCNPLLRMFSTGYLIRARRSVAGEER
jgi:hypothetical protein